MKRARNGPLGSGTYGDCVDITLHSTLDLCDCYLKGAGIGGSATSRRTGLRCDGGSDTLAGDQGRQQGEREDDGGEHGDASYEVKDCSGAKVGEQEGRRMRWLVTVQVEVKVEERCG